jgi:hypothetical protein
MASALSAFEGTYESTLDPRDSPDRLVVRLAGTLRLRERFLMSQN